MPKKRGRGRPKGSKKPPGELRSKYVPIYFTDAEREKLQEKADASKARSLSSWARDVLLREAGLPADPPRVALDPDLRATLEKILRDSSPPGNR